MRAAARFVLLVVGLLGCVQPKDQVRQRQDAQPCRESTCVAECVLDGYTWGRCVDVATCRCQADHPVDPKRPERCGDGLDNDGDKEVDELCGCTPGDTQSCYAGSVESRDRAFCRSGLQKCLLEGEFGSWGPCEGQVLPDEEVCDRVDNDCDAAIDEGCPGACVPLEWGTETACFDGRDNDCDGLFDCDDPDCPACWTTEECGNDRDDDWDGLVDCDDGDCCLVPGCESAAICATACCVPGTWRYCDTPLYCSWGRQQCRPDGNWGQCEETGERPNACAGQSFYSPECCVEAGACCQNYGLDPAQPFDASVGACDGIVAACG